MKTCLDLPLLLLLGLLATSSFAQTPNEILAAELDTFVLNQLTTKSIPGLSACIVKGDQVVWKAAYGTANFSTGTPVTLGTEFTLASISKLFTATACAQLWEDGLLDLDADINTYLPITVNNPSFPITPITARQLLQHRSSLHDSESDLQLWDAPGDPIYDLETFCVAYFVPGGSLYVASNFGSTAPGTSSYWYSNAGFTLLGYLVQEISGMPFNTYCQLNILAPLEMEDAGWFYAEVDSAGVAMPYTTSFVPFHYYSVPEYPAAMLKANVEELAHFLIAYTQKGTYKGIQLVHDTTFAALVPDDMMNGFGWWGTDTWWGDPTGNFWSHGGFMNGVRTQLNYYPDDSTGLIILTNGEGNYAEIQSELEAYIDLFEMESTTAVDEEAMVEVSIAPNPISPLSSVQIKMIPLSPASIFVRLTDVQGKTILEKNTTAHEFDLLLPPVPGGIYLLDVQIGDQWIQKKLLITD